MKKRDLKSLKLNKKSISNFRTSEFIKGGSSCDELDEWSNRPCSYTCEFSCRLEEV